MTTKEKFIEEMEIDDAPVSICRLCAQITSSKSFIPLYTEDQQEETITKQINQLVIDLISPDDGLPQEVCIQCSKNVELCFTFITKIIETQNKLKRLIQSPKSKDMANEDEYADSSNKSKNKTMPPENEMPRKKKEFVSRLNFNKKKITKPSLPAASAVVAAAAAAAEENTSVEENCGSNRTTTTTTTTESSSNIGNSNKKNLVEFKVSSAVAVTNDLDDDKVKKKQKKKKKKKKSKTKKENVTKIEKRLYRCGLCLANFTEKEMCIDHIFLNHPNLKHVKRRMSSSPPRPSRAPMRASDTTTKKSSETPYGHDKSSDTSLCKSSSSSVSSASSFTSFLSSEWPKLEEHRRSRSRSSSSSSSSNCSSDGNVGGKALQKFDTKKSLKVESFYKEIQKQCVRFVCDKCGRLMSSWFVFKRHLSEHKLLNDGNELATKNEEATAKLRRKTYCETCGKYLKHAKRHNVFHTVLQLEN